MTYAQSVILEAFLPVLDMGLESGSTALPLYSIPVSHINDRSIIGTYLMIRLGFLFSRSFTLECHIGVQLYSTPVLHICQLSKLVINNEFFCVHRIGPTWTLRIDPTWTLCGIFIIDILLLYKNARTGIIYLFALAQVLHGLYAEYLLLLVIISIQGCTIRSDMPFLTQRYPIHHVAISLPHVAISLPHVGLNFHFVLVV